MEISREKILIAPKLLPNGDLIYSYIDNCEEISLNSNSIPILSAKEFFFQDEEELFEYDYNPAQNFVITPAKEPEERVI